MNPRHAAALARVLRHEHWRMSQLSENVASEPVQLVFAFSSETPPPSAHHRENNGQALKNG